MGRNNFGRQRTTQRKEIKKVAKKTGSTEVIRPEHPEIDTKDERLIGFWFPNHMGKSKTPMDFLRSANSGRTYGLSDGAWGIATHDISLGWRVKTTLPPLAIWNKGRWLDDFLDDWEPIWDCHPNGNYDKRINYDKRVYVVHGEGTPGEYVFRAYLLPREIAEDAQPKHPLDWPKHLLPVDDAPVDVTFSCQKKEDWLSRPQDSFLHYHISWLILKNGYVEPHMIPEYPKEYTGPKLNPGAKNEKPTTGFSAPPVGGGWGYGTKPKPLPTPPKTTTAPSLPVGVKMRCLCGHWFTESNLAGHSKVCAALNNEGDKALWSVVCDDKCGCEYIEDFPTERHRLGVKTLDHVSRCKPGYPEHMKEVTVSETPDETPAEEPETEAEAKTPEAEPATA